MTASRATNDKTNRQNDIFVMPTSVYRQTSNISSTL